MAASKDQLGGRDLKECGHYKIINQCGRTMFGADFCLAYSQGAWQLTSLSCMRLKEPPYNEGTNFQKNLLDISQKKPHRTINRLKSPRIESKYFLIFDEHPNKKY